MRHKDRQRKALERERQMVRKTKRMRVTLGKQQKKVTVQSMMKVYRMKRSEVSKVFTFITQVEV